MTFAPSGACGQYNGQTVFTHGVEFGMAPKRDRTIFRTATDELIQSLAGGNPVSAARPASQRVTVANQRGLRDSAAESI